MVPYTPQDIINQTNQYRVQSGLPALKADQSLMKAAQARARDMALTGDFSHTVATTTASKKPWQFMTKNGYNFEYAGENLAAHFPDATSTVEAWKNSKTHNANLVDKKYKDIGVAVVPVKEKGYDTTYVVQFFGSRPK